MTTTDERRPLRIGFLGAGLIATYHSKMLARSNVEFERVGVYDPDRERAELFARGAGCEVLDDEAAVIERSDAVYVCTWTSEHARLVAAAAARGVHVFCEKPLAGDLAGAEAMLRTVRDAGITHQVGLVLRRSPAFVVMRDLVRDDTAGRVMAVVFRDDQYIPLQGHYSSTWRADRTLAGSGTLLEHSIHDVDLLRSIVGEIETVNAHERNLHGHDGIEDTVSATVCFDGGALGTLTSVWHDNLARPSLRRVEVLCERRHVVMDGDDWAGPVSWTDADGATGVLEGDELEAAAVVVLAEETARGVGIDGLSTNPDHDFVVAAAGGRPAWPDLSVAVEAHRVVDAMYRSARSDGATTPVGSIPAHDHRVVELAVTDLYPLRRSVLRSGTVTQDVRFDEDDGDGVAHLGVVDGSESVVAISTWVPRAHSSRPGEPGVQLRGMATAPEVRGTGAGRALLTAGIERARRWGAEHVWARARDTALDFYLANGFDVVGDGYVDAATGLAHHDVVRAPASAEPGCDPSGDGS